MSHDETHGEVKRTPLYDAHVRAGGKMVPFAGWWMPVQYGSIHAEHRAVREAVGIFDVSHMGELVLDGPRALEAVQAVTTNDAAALEVDQEQYSAICREDGGIVDDCVVCRMGPERYMIVVNASNVEKDRSWIEARIPGDGVTLEDDSEATALLAVQGPRAIDVVAPLADVDLADLRFYWKRDGRIAGVPATISRTGYTGEDGFELYVPADRAAEVWDALLVAGGPAGIRPCGLGARDTLRLEMKYALYGNDIDEGTNPYEAGLGWIVKLDKGPFVGSEALARVKAEGPARRLVGFRTVERGIPRPHHPVLVDGEAVSEVRSGTMSPTLGYGIGTAYLPRASAKAGTPIAIDVRGTRVAAEVAKTPFYEGGSLHK